MKVLNLTIEGAQSAARIVLQAAGMDHELAMKAIVAAKNLPDGCSFDLERAIEFVGVFTKWPAFKARLYTVAGHNG